MCRTFLHQTHPQITEISGAEEVYGQFILPHEILQVAHRNLRISVCMYVCIKEWFYIVQETLNYGSFLRKLPLGQQNSQYISVSLYVCMYECITIVQKYTRSCHEIFQHTHTDNVKVKDG